MIRSYWMMKGGKLARYREWSGPPYYRFLKWKERSLKQKILFFVKFKKQIKAMEFCDLVMKKEVKVIQSITSSSEGMIYAVVEEVNS